MDELRLKVLHLSFKCPKNQDNPESCPLYELRKENTKTRLKIVQEMTNDQVREIVLNHRGCIGGCMK